MTRTMFQRISQFTTWVPAKDCAGFLGFGEWPKPGISFGIRSKRTCYGCRRAMRICFQIAIVALRLLLLRKLAPRPVAGLGGLIQCRDCGPLALPTNACGIGTVSGFNCPARAIFRSVPDGDRDVSGLEGGLQLERKRFGERTREAWPRVDAAAFGSAYRGARSGRGGSAGEGDRWRRTRAATPA